MRNLQFNFKLEHDDAFSTSYKENFHKNWIDLRFNASLIKIKVKDVHFRKIELPPKDGTKLTVVLNLDETLPTHEELRLLELSMEGIVQEIEYLKAREERMRDTNGQFFIS